MDTTNIKHSCDSSPYLAHTYWIMENTACTIYTLFQD